MTDSKLEHEVGVALGFEAQTQLLGSGEVIDLHVCCCWELEE